MKVAVLGMNHGYKFAKDIVKMPDAQLAAVAGRDDLSRKRAEKLGVPLFEDYKNLINQCELDGVIITLPNALHKEAVEYCADKGLDILVEKPIAPTIAEGKAMIDYCTERNVKLMVGHHRRFSSKITRLRELIASNVIGEIIGVNMLWVLAKDKPYYSEPWRITKGGGPLLINGIHDIDNLRFVTGLDIESVYAATRNKIRGNEIEDSASIILEASNGATINYFISDGIPAPWSYEFNLKENGKYHYYEEDCYHFFGTKGSIAFPSFRIFTYEEAHYGWEHALVKNELAINGNDPMTAEARHFINVLKGEASALITGEDGLKTLEVLEAIQISAEQERKVRMGSHEKVK
jgi:predicted dehydrogenase